MGWQIAIAATSAVVGVFNAYDEYQQNRTIRRDLDKIKDYLIGIDRKVDEVISQNKEIIEKLDLLPDQFKQIVTEVVDVALLRERYSAIKDIRDNFLILRGGRSYRLRSEAWHNFSSAMQYLIDYEYRISKSFELIAMCEVALVITKERALRLVIHRVDVKRLSLIELKDEVIDEINSLLTTLQTHLNNSKYVKSHNLSSDLADISLLQYEMMPNRTKKIHYTERVCVTVDVGRYRDFTRQQCHDERKTKRVPDKAFHNSRDKHKKRIDSGVDHIKQLISRVKELNGVIASYTSYLDRISSESKIVNDGIIPKEHLNNAVDNDNVVDVHWMYEASDTTSSKVGTSSHEFDDDFDDYIDGCHGECSEIENHLIQENNIYFMREVLPPCDHR